MRVLSHPGVALAVVTLVGTATLITPVVDWGARSAFGRDADPRDHADDRVPAVAAGDRTSFPGRACCRPIGRAGYLFASSIVVTSLSIVWIFARHPLYPGLHHQHELLGMSAAAGPTDRRLRRQARRYAPMWAVAFTIFARADREAVPAEETPLHWADVERELLRVDRQRARRLRRRPTG